MRLTRFHFSGALLAFFAPLAARAASPYYVSPAGSDGASGAIDAPFASWAHAQSVAKAGDIVYFRQGTYAFTKGLTACGSGTDTIDGVKLTVSGTAGNPISYFAYAGETPVFDFSGIKDSCRVKGVEVTASYVYLKGLEIMGTPQGNTMNHESWAIWNSGSHNTYELLNLHDNMGPGLFISKGGNNLVLNTDSHDNYDPFSSANGVVTPGQNADGFGCHIGVGDTGNVFRGCRAWRNTDDGWDFIQAQEVVTVENSWAWDMGTAMYKGALVSPANGNGNGFKGGGYGEPVTNFPANPPHHVIRHCLAVGNKAAGFYANHEPVADYWYNNTSYANHPGFNLLGDPTGTNVAGNVGILRNNLALSGTLLSNNTGAGVDESFNSWDGNLGVTVTAADFQGMNVSVTGLDAARKADGSLPDVTNFHLAPGSDLIDKGTNVGLPYNGTAPDLGAFETGPALSSGGSGGAGAGGAGTAGTGTGTAGSGTAGAGTGTAGTSNSGTGGSGSAGFAGSGVATSGAAGVTGIAGAAPSAGAAGAGNGSAGANSNGGAVGTGGVHSGASGGAGANDTNAADQSGCSCRTAGDHGETSSSFALLPLLALLGLARRKRRN